MRASAHDRPPGPISLAWMLTRRDLKNRYASSYAGIAWNVGVPLFYALINVVVFSILMGSRMGERYGGVPFALFYFVPLSLWTVFSEVTGRSTGILREYGYLINKIAFPVWVLPLVPLGSAMISQGILLAIIGALLVFYGIPLTVSAAAFVLLWAFSILLTLGVAYAIAALSVYVPDMVPMVPLVTSVLFWLTPILYPVALVESSGALWARNVIVNFNPFFYMVEAAREAVLPGGQMHWSYVLVVGVTALACFAAGTALFRKLKSGFADVL
jgi:lipopolysaccharide transport system permease protein